MKTPDEIRISIQNQADYSDGLVTDIDELINCADDLTEEEKDWAFDNLGIHITVDII